jgi:hypothetical protein
VRDFAATVERIVDDNEVGLHILDMGIDLTPDERGVDVVYNNVVGDT